VECKEKAGIEAHKILRNLPTHDSPCETTLGVFQEVEDNLAALRMLEREA
jgi:hypothetical protein